MKTILFLLFCITVNISGEVLKSEMAKSKKVITVEYKNYSISPTEQIGLYGVKERFFVSDQMFFGRAGYGAISGRRGGYLEGGVIGGVFFQLESGTQLEFRLFAGAGGGSSAPQGGGFIVQPTLGFGIPLNREYSLGMDLGYIHFVNGNISSLVLAFNLNINGWDLSVDQKAAPK